MVLIEIFHRHRRCAYEYQQFVRDIGPKACMRIRQVSVRKTVPVQTCRYKTNIRFFDRRIKRRDEIKKAIANFVVWKSESSFSSQATAIRPAGLVRTRSLYNSHGQSGRWQFHRNCCQFFLKNKKGKSPPYGNFYLFIYNNTIKQLFFQICPDHPSRFFLFLDHIFQEICRTGIIGILFFLELFDVLTDFTN